MTAANRVGRLIRLRKWQIRPPSPDKPPGESTIGALRHLRCHVGKHPDELIEREALEWLTLHLGEQVVAA
jgi:hypothetical protein